MDEELKELCNVYITFAMKANKCGFLLTLSCFGFGWMTNNPERWISKGQITDK